MKLVILVMGVLFAQFAQARCYMGHGNWDPSGTGCETDSRPRKPMGYYACDIGSNAPVKYYRYEVYLPGIAKQVYLYDSLEFSQPPSSEEIQNSETCKPYLRAGQPCEVLQCEYR